jgi:hypothetical protein
MSRKLFQEVYQVTAQLNVAEVIHFLFVSCNKYKKKDYSSRFHLLFHFELLVRCLCQHIDLAPSPKENATRVIVDSKWFILSRIVVFSCVEVLTCCRTPTRDITPYVEELDSIRLK